MKLKLPWWFPIAAIIRPSILRGGRVIHQAWEHGCATGERLARAEASGDGPPRHLHVVR